MRIYLPEKVNINCLSGTLTTFYFIFLRIRRSPSVVLMLKFMTYLMGKCLMIYVFWSTSESKVRLAP